jgi:hypothetical protein
VAGESPSPIPAIAQDTVSSVKLCLSLSEVDCFHAAWNQILLQSCNVFYPSKKYLYFIKSKLVRFFTFCTYLLTPWSRVLLEKPSGFAASQEIPRIYGTRKFITVLISARHLSLF